MLLITGVARSGTRYISQVLQAAGLDVGHEEFLGKDGIVSWEWAVTDSIYPPWHVQGAQPKFDAVLHQTRNPIETINSLCTASFNKESWEYLCKHTHTNIDDPILKRSAEAWYYWSIKAHNRASWTYRVETLLHNHKEFSARLGIREITKEHILAVPENTNTTRYEKPSYTWNDIREITPLYIKIASLARRYGYEVKYD